MILVVIAILGIMGGMMAIEKIIFAHLFFQDEDLNRVQSGLENIFLQVDRNFQNVKTSLDSIGAIKTSILTELQFNDLNSGVWVLCDGRSIASSLLSKLTGDTNAPNMTGSTISGVPVNRFVKTG